MLKAVSAQHLVKTSRTHTVLTILSSVVALDGSIRLGSLDRSH